MLKQLSRCTLSCLVAVLLAVSVSGAAAQGDGVGPVAAVQNGQLVILGADGTPLVVPLPDGVQGISNLTWSPDGTVLAFLISDQEYNSHLMMTDPAGSSLVELAADVAFDFPLTFTEAGEIVYVTSTGQFVEREGEPGRMVMAVYRVMPQAGAAPFQMLTFEFGVGCGGGSSIPVHWLYWEEANVGPSGGPKVLAMTPFGLVYSLDCTGYGIGLLDSVSNTSAQLGTGLAWAQLSPDGTQLVAVDDPSRQRVDGQIVLVDLATQTVTPVQTAVPGNKAVWSADGSAIYYAAAQETGQVPEEASAQQQIGEVIGMMEPTTLPVYAVSIHRFTLADGADTELYAGDGYAIGRMLVTPGGDALFFSQVPNITAWVQAVIGGGLDMASAGSLPVSELLPVDVYQLSLTDGATSLVGSNLGQMAVPTS